MACTRLSERAKYLGVGEAVRIERAAIVTEFNGEKRAAGAGCFGVDLACKEYAGKRHWLILGQGFDSFDVELAGHFSGKGLDRAGILEFRDLVIGRYDEDRLFRFHPKILFFEKFRGHIFQRFTDRLER